MKGEIIDQYRNFYERGHLNAKFLLIVLINGIPAFSKNFSNLKDAENLGYDMIKSCDWYNFGRIHNIDYEIINLENGEIIGESKGFMVLQRKVS
jgi:hypothetical protein